MPRFLSLVFLAIFGFAAAAWGQPPGVGRLDDLRIRPYVSCGGAGQICCEPYQGSRGVIGPSHCNEGLGCNVATNRCERPCGSAGQVCCDGPETWAAQGGPLYLDSNGNLVIRKPMCEASACDAATRRCAANCGLNAGDPCCGPQPHIGVGTCLNPALACRFSAGTFESGVCESCGQLGQIPCARSQGCAEGLDEDPSGVCGCNPGYLESLAVSATNACSRWPKRRATCFERSLVHSIQGSEVRPSVAPGAVCVEAAFKRENGVYFVDVDNPRIWDGAMVKEATRTGLGASFREIDHVTEVYDGDGAPSQGGFFAADASGPVASVNATLPRIPSRIGVFGLGPGPEKIDLVTPGVRVGHRPVTVAVHDVDANQTALPSAATFRMALNPDVLLAPVQVFAVYSDAQPAAAEAFSRERALTVFDRAADVGSGKWRATDGDGRVSSITVPLPHLALAGDIAPATAKFTLPDDIWAQCGVQFRLVNYTQLKVPDELTSPRGHQTIQSAVRLLLDEVRNSPAFLPGILTVIAAPWCSDVNQAPPGEFFSPLGQALVGSAALCVRNSSAGTTLAHEIGHIVLSDSGHSACTGETADNLMCPANGGPDLSREQCARARSTLMGSPSLLRFPEPR